VKEGGEERKVMSQFEDERLEGGGAKTIGKMLQTQKAPFYKGGRNLKDHRKGGTVML